MMLIIIFQLIYVYNIIGCKTHARVHANQVFTRLIKFNAQETLTPLSHS